MKPFFMFVGLVYLVVGLTENLLLRSGTFKNVFISYENIIEIMQRRKQNM
jgi:hypothetical protein